MSVIRGEMKRFSCHFLSLREERADGERAGWAEAAQRLCSGSCGEGRAGLSSTLGARFTVQLHCVVSCAS